MEFAIAIPQTYSDPARIQRFLRRAEELPLIAAWCIEQVIGTAPVLESVTTLTYAARGHETFASRNRRFADRSAEPHWPSESLVIASTCFRTGA